jgi:hypothetical protein
MYSEIRIAGTSVRLLLLLLLLRHRGAAGRGRKGETAGEQNIETEMLALSIDPTLPDSHSPLFIHLPSYLHFLLLLFIYLAVIFSFSSFNFPFSLFFFFSFFLISPPRHAKCSTTEII